VEEPDSPMLNESEQVRFASYAMRSADSRGRVYPQVHHQFRTVFQRDRDRIVHSVAFRRLQYKTQVFVNFEGDHYRTRLTHTLEVAQIARSIARALSLNEDLTETIALAHDLGHTPFGHSGETVMNVLMENYGGFEHNRQSLRVVDVLEKRYPDHPGLNLTYEVREGIIRHESAYDSPEGSEWSDGQPTLECQIVNAADEIAYNCHDLDDGLVSGLLDESDLESVKVWRVACSESCSAFPDLDDDLRRADSVRHLIDRQVGDVVRTSLRNVEDAGVSSVADVRSCDHPLIAFSDELITLNQELKAALLERLYQHYRLLRMAEKARRILTDLFEVYRSNPRQLPRTTRLRAETDGVEQAICDYIAGMTDRYALREHKKLFDALELV
jgi:dGTPase